MPTQQFQQVQAERGRPLAVIVTSRTAVANRARVPAESLVLRLEPFDEDQIRHWVSVWNRSNARYFTSHDLRPLPIDDVLVARDLAEQPLLLLMLALYDASANALSRSRGELHEADLYERLLVEFAKREVLKPSRRGLSAQDLAREIEDELYNLAITAFAMFNRRRQWVIENELDDDLRNLLCQPERPKQAHGFRRPITGAEGVIGSFFFVHKSRALRDDQHLQTYEFLHATFGEYLMARLITRELVDFTGELALAESRNRPTPPDDAFLRALLSFALISERAPILDFLEHGIKNRITADRREPLQRYLCEQLAGSLQARNTSEYDKYEPLPLTVPARHALYSANLLLLCALAADRPLEAADFLHTHNPPSTTEEWQKIATLWKSQLTGNQWSTLTHTLRVHHSSTSLTIHLKDESPFDLTELSIFQPGPERLIHKSSFPVDHPAASWLRELSFRGEQMMVRLLISVSPYIEHVHGDISTLYGAVDLGIFSPAYELMTLLMADRRDLLLHAYARAFYSTHVSNRYKELVFAKFAEDLAQLPSEGLLEIFRDYVIPTIGNEAERDELRRLLHLVQSRPDIDAKLYREVERRLDERVILDRDSDQTAAVGQDGVDVG